MAVPQAEGPREVEHAEDRGSGFRYLLGSRDFRLIWLAQVAAQLADKFLMFSLIILAYRISHGSTPVAVTLLAYTVPAVAIAPLAGVFADRWDRKGIMVSTNVVRAGLVALIPIAAWVPGLGHDYAHLLVVTFAFAAVGQLFSPAEAAAIPTVICREALITANSLVLVTMVLTLVLGGGLAPIVSRADIYAPYWIAVALFALAGSLIVFARIPRPTRAAEPLAVPRNPFHQLAVDLRAGAATLGGSPTLLLVFAELSLAVLVMFMMFTLAPAYVSQVLGIADQDSYVILVPATAGALLSALVLGNLGRRLSPAGMLIGGLGAAGLTLMLLASVPAAAAVRSETRWVAAGFSLLLGLEFGVLLIPGLTHLMEHTSDGVRGRVFALLFMVVNGVTALPVLVAAALADLIGISRVVFGLGVLLVAAAMLVARYARRAFAAAAPPR